MMKTKFPWMMFAGTVLSVLCGCKPAEKPGTTEGFPQEDDSRSYRRFALAQEAAGARHDGTFYKYHFDGEHLNSLGESKLSLMLKNNDHTWPVIIYMNVPEDGQMKGRQDAVLAYLMDSGVLDHQVRFEVGINPDASSSAEKNLARLSKTESESGVASNPTNPSSSGYGTGGGGDGK
jgi:hypothetical protein